jgi:hypothetical protein
MVKSVIPNTCNAVGNTYTGKADAAVESLFPNTGNIVEIALNNSSYRISPMLNLYPVRN